MKQLPLIQVNPMNGDRYYVNEYKPSLKYASVTNVLAKTVSKSMAYGLQIWRQKQIDAGLDPDIELRKAAQRGSDLHDWTEKYINGETPRVLPEYKQYTDKIQQCPIWKHIDEVICTEQKVWTVERHWGEISLSFSLTVSCTILHVSYITEYIRISWVLDIVYILARW